MSYLIYFLAVIGMVVSQKWEERGYTPKFNFKPAPLSNDGRVVDTPEIANLKQAHFAAHDAAKRALPNQRPYYPDYNQQRSQPYQEEQQRYQPSQQYNKYQPQQEYNRYQPQQDYDNYDDRNNDDYTSNNVEKRWRGPLAKIELTNDGKFVKETPEVAHARHQHLAAFAQVKQNRPSIGYEGHKESDYNGNYQGQPEHRNYNDGNNYNNQYNGGNNYEDDGQYRGEAAYSGQQNQQYNQQGGQYNGQYDQPRSNWNGPSQQYRGGQDRYY